MLIFYWLCLCIISNQATVSKSIILANIINVKVCMYGCLLLFQAKTAKWILMKHCNNIAYTLE